MVYYVNIELRDDSLKTFYTVLKKVYKDKLGLVNEKWNNNNRIHLDYYTRSKYNNNNEEMINNMQLKHYNIKNDSLVHLVLPGRDC